MNVLLSFIHAKDNSIIIKRTVKSVILSLYLGSCVFASDKVKEEEQSSAPRTEKVEDEDIYNDMPPLEPDPLSFELSLSMQTGGAGIHSASRAPDVETLAHDLQRSLEAYQHDLGYFIPQSGDITELQLLERIDDFLKIARPSESPGKIKKIIHGASLTKAFIHWKQGDDFQAFLPRENCANRYPFNAVLGHFLSKAGNRCNLITFFESYSTLSAPSKNFYFIAALEIMTSYMQGAFITVKPGTLNSLIKRIMGPITQNTVSLPKHYEALSILGAMNEKPDSYFLYETHSYFLKYIKPYQAAIRDALSRINLETLDAGTTSERIRILRHHWSKEQDELIALEPTDSSNRRLKRLLLGDEATSIRAPSLPLPTSGSDWTTAFSTSSTVGQGKRQARTDRKGAGTTASSGGGVGVTTDSSSVEHGRSGTFASVSPVFRDSLRGLASAIKREDPFASLGATLTPLPPPALPRSSGSSWATFSSRPNTSSTLGQGKRQIHTDRTTAFSDNGAGAIASALSSPVSSALSMSLPGPDLGTVLPHSLLLGDGKDPVNDGINSDREVDDATKNTKKDHKRKKSDDNLSPQKVKPRESVALAAASADVSESSAEDAGGYSRQESTKRQRKTQVEYYYTADLERIKRTMEGLIAASDLDRSELTLIKSFLEHPAGIDIMTPQPQVALKYEQVSDLLREAMDTEKPIEKRRGKLRKIQRIFSRAQ